MTPESQQIAIAEACGWISQGRAKGVPALAHKWRNPVTREFQTFLPDYLTDLNAMHEAEKVLNKTGRPGCQWALYGFKLAKIVSGDASLIHATAAQRAEAFLRTIGKWVE